MKDPVYDSTTDHLSTIAAIPREFKISNALPPFLPTYRLNESSLAPDPFLLAQKIVNVYMPAFDLSVPSTFTELLTSFQNLFAMDDRDGTMTNSVVRLYLMDCHAKFTALTGAPSLTRLSLLHNHLSLTTDLFREGSLPQELMDYSSMITGEVLDLFNCHFSDVVEQKFWAKTKTAEDVIQQLLKKEVARLRMLSPYSFKVLSQSAVRRSIDNAPASAAPALISWANANNIVIDS